MISIRTYRVLWVALACAIVFTAASSVFCQDQSSSSRASIRDDDTNLETQLYLILATNRADVNGIVVYKAEGVYVQNLSACNFMSGNKGGGDEIRFGPHHLPYHGDAPALAGKLRAWAAYFFTDFLPRTEAVASRVLTLPLYPHMPDEAVTSVADAIASAEATSARGA